MTREEYKKTIQDIMKNAGNQAELSMLLTKLNDDYEEVLTGLETHMTTAETLTKDNERLRDVNMQLFLKVGHEKPAETTPEAQKDPETKPTEISKDFSELFNEKGELK